MSLFYDVAAALTEPNLDRALERTLQLVAEYLRLDAAWVWLLDEDNGQFYLAASYDLPPYLREPLHMTGEPCWCMQAFFDGDFVQQNVDIISCSRLRDGIDEVGEGATRGLRSHASIALRFGKRELGLLNAARAANPSLQQDELETLAAIGAQVGVAVERSRLSERAAAAARIEERVSLARELHDTIVQDLTAIALHLESAERKTKNEPAKAQERIVTALSLTRDALDELRRNVDGLRNDPLAGEPLVPAIARLGRTFTSETGVQLNLRAPDHLPELASDAEFTVYRVVSEALANVARHAQARRVEVGIGIESNAMTVTIHDDGRGFETAGPQSGFGLIGMKERAESLGGVLRIRSTRDAGTTIGLSLPLERT
ncbi:MAG TPA: GAF domain-containing sensor histidine kinase [Candidatus Baltobacteraceae bacterium]|nr:GAF domain-containing sensor histidine kinase [Candidatus Baltobacteraceae bacterium]